MKARLQQAWESDTYAEARRGLNEIKAELEQTCPKAAASMAEGPEDTLSLHKFGLDKALRDRLKTSNIIENLNSVVAYRTRNVKRWSSSDQRHRWCASIFMQFESNLTAIDESLMDELRQALKRETIPLKPTLTTANTHLLTNSLNQPRMGRSPKAHRIDEVLQTQLNPEQFQAAIDPSPTILCLACAGSGKSRTLAYRIARLISQGADPAGIVAITFTNKAAESIKQRVSHALEQADLDPRALNAMYIGTIHAFCLQTLREMDAKYNQYDVLDANRLRLFLMNHYGDLGLDSLKRIRNSKYFATIREVASALSVMNGELISVDCLEREMPQLGQTLTRLVELLDQKQFIDYSSMPRLLANALEAAQPDAVRAISHIQHVIIDEYQDVEPALERLIRMLSAQANSLFCVGDDDQAIYAWKGADVTNILDFEDRHERVAVHTLSVNYRSTEAIVNSADSFVQKELGPQRVYKSPRADHNPSPRALGVHWFADRESEADWVVDRIKILLGTKFVRRDGTELRLSPIDFAILMRSTDSSEKNGASRHEPYTQRLSTQEIPFEVQSAGNVFTRPHARAVLEMLELLRNGMTTRIKVQAKLNSIVIPVFPSADLSTLANVLGQWGRRIHSVSGGRRSSIDPQKFLYEILDAFRVTSADLHPQALRDLGVVSQMLQDVESVYMSVDSASRYQQMLNFMQNPTGVGYDSRIQEVAPRPHAVTVSTVHKMKGLEFPVVFVVDVEQGRFPTSRSRYRGWVPRSCIQRALDRGAYQGTREGEIRLFYTAITRAERFLYVTGCASLPGGTKSWRQSDFAKRIIHSEVTHDPESLPARLEPASRTPLSQDPNVPTSFSEVRQYLCCPYKYKLRHIYGFSPPISEMFGFGKTVHTVISALHQRFPANAPSRESARNLTKDIFHLKHVAASSDPINRPGPYERAKERACEIAADYAESFGTDFGQRRQVEMRFEVPLANAVINGSIDLLLKEDIQGEVLDARVVDFKTIDGGENPTKDSRLQWTELALQVQLYAHAAHEVANETARSGHVHLLKGNSRIDVPVTNEAIEAALGNVKWVIDRVLSEDFPQRPHPDKCGECDFHQLCAKRAEAFDIEELPPAIHLPSGETQMARAFSQFRSP